MNRGTCFVHIPAVILLLTVSMTAGVFAKDAPEDKRALKAGAKVDLSGVNVVPMNQDRDRDRPGDRNRELDETVWTEDFEEGTDDWVFYGTDPTYWQTSNYNPYNGNNWRCYSGDFGANGGYNNHWLQWMVTPEIDLSGVNNPILRFYMRIMCEPPDNPIDPFDSWDGGNVWVSGDGGETWEVLEVTTGPEYNRSDSWAFGERDDGQGYGMGTGIPTWCGLTDFSEWQLVTMSLSDYAGEEEVMIAFAFASDLAAATGDNQGDDTWTGFQLDNISVGDPVGRPLFSDDADGNNVGGEFTMYSGNYVIWGLKEDEDGNSFVGMDYFSVNFEQHYIYTGEIDLTDYEEGVGETFLDLKVSGTWSYEGAEDIWWTVKLSPDDGETWYFASDPMGETGDEDVYNDAPEDWEWFSEEWEETWDLSPYHGMTLQARIDVFCPDEGFTYFTDATDRYLYFDDLTILHPYPPEPFELLSPEDEEQVNTGSPTLEWEETEDPDGDDILYSIYYSLDPDFQDAEVIDSLTETSYTFDEDMLQRWVRTDRELDEFEDDVTVYWKVHAQDFDTDGTWSSPEEGWSFDIFIFDPPNDFNLISPQDGSTEDTLDVLFEWWPARDPDEGDEITYTLYLSTNQGFTDPQTFDTGEETSHIVEGLNDDAQYWWKVHAQDTNTDGTFSEVWSFLTSWPQPPDPFSLLTPENGATIFADEAMEATFTWEASDDPDPRQGVNYNFNMDITIGEEPYTIRRQNIEETQLTLNIPEEIGVDDWTEPMECEWWVVARSAPDETECNERFQLRVTSLDVEEGPYGGIPEEYSLSAVYPNPFNPALTVVVGLPEAAQLDVSLFNVLGQRIAVIAQGNQSAGYKRFSFDAAGLSSGIYFLRAEVPGEMQEMRKVVLAR